MKFRQLVSVAAFFLVVLCFSGQPIKASPLGLNVLADHPGQAGQAIPVGGHKGRPWRPHGGGHHGKPHHGKPHWEKKLERHIKREIRRERRKRIIGGIVAGAIIANEINKAAQGNNQCVSMSNACNQGNRYACDDYYRYCRR